MSAGIIQKTVTEYAERAYLEYAMSVVKGRAIPSVEDGLKPVHRRILYAMFKEGMVYSSVHKKSARVVGNVLGLYHPHGDQSVYEAMVRQTQDFSVRYPLIDGQGNFGSRDGDGAASMRYTEAKLAAISQIFLDELKDNCVDFIPNYDGSETEPRFMPSRVPFILINGNPGIGVGMSTDIPSHNLTEVLQATIAYLETNEPTLDLMMEYIKGPDYNTAAQIISSSSELRKIYEDGRGSFRMRSKYVIEDEGTKNWKIVFNEIPNNVSVQKVMEEIEDLFNPEAKLKGKKDSKGKEKKPSVEQLNQKNLMMSLIGRTNDGSSKDSPVRLVIEPKTSKVKPEAIVQALLAYTSLENNVPTNFVVVGRDGNPVQKNLLNILAEWVDFRIETIRRRVEYHLKKLAERLHILEGREKILSNIDKVIEIIKNSNDSKKDLMQEFDLSEIQAQDVLELKLRQLGNLELSSIVKEVKENKKKTDDLNKIIVDGEKSIKKQMVKELKKDLEDYGDERKTEIKVAEKINMADIQEKTVMNSQEDITLAISEKEWVKVVRGIKTADAISFKEGDALDYLFHCKNTDTLAIFDVEGKVYNFPLIDVSKDGSPINTLAQINSKIALACPINKEHNYVLTQDCGLGFIVSGSVLMTKVKAGKDMITMKQGASILQPLYYLPKEGEQEDNRLLALITSEQKLLVYPLNTVSKTSGKAQGVKLVTLPDGEKIKAVKIVSDDKLIVVATGKSGKQQTFNLEGDSLKSYIKGRGTKGGLLNTRDKDATIEFGVEEEASIPITGK